MWLYSTHAVETHNNPCNCQSECDDTNECTSNRCELYDWSVNPLSIDISYPGDEYSGRCVTENIPNLATCCPGDDIVCTQDLCWNGQCSSFPQNLNCPLINECKAGICGESGCSYTPDPSKCTLSKSNCETYTCNVDGFCNTELDNTLCVAKAYDCETGACVGAEGDEDGCSFLPNDDYCNDGYSCSDDECIGHGTGVGTLDSDGCSHTPNDNHCDDGEPCTINECEFSEPDIYQCSSTGLPDDTPCDTGDPAGCEEQCINSVCSCRSCPGCDDPNGSCDDYCNCVGTIPSDNKKDIRNCECLSLHPGQEVAQQACTGERCKCACKDNKGSGNNGCNGNQCNSGFLFGNQCPGVGVCCCSYLGPDDENPTDEDEQCDFTNIITLPPTMSPQSGIPVNPVINDGTKTKKNAAYFIPNEEISGNSNNEEIVNNDHFYYNKESIKDDYKFNEDMNHNNDHVDNNDNNNKVEYDYKLNISEHTTIVVGIATLFITLNVIWCAWKNNNDLLKQDEQDQHGVEI